MISVEDLKKSLKKYNYEILTDGDDEVALRAIESANIWLLAKLEQAGCEVSSKIFNAIIEKRALYELYSYAESEEVARDKKEDALELLKSVIANKGNVEDKPSKKPCVFIKGD